MSLSIQLSPELEKKLRESASNAGLDVSQYIVEILEGQLPRRPVRTSQKSNSSSESELLEKINLGIPVALWKRYNYLKDLRDRIQLDPDEQLELIQISDQIEEANAERMKYLIELAELKKVPLRQLMQSLGIKAGEHV